MNKIYNILKKMFFIESIDTIEADQFSPKTLRKIKYFIRRLNSQPEEELTSIELDFYLDLSNKEYNYYSIKAIRAKNIKEINQYFKFLYGKEFIERKKEKIDNRYTIYKINKY